MNNSPPSAEDAVPEFGSGTVSRRRVLVWFGAGVAGLTGLGWLAARAIRSPQQVLADTSPPERGVLTAPVELRVLRDTVVLRGMVGADQTIDVTPAPAEGRPIVTGVRLNADDEFTLGTVLVEVAGRPLVAMAGKVPAYRDLRPGSTGKDVSQLQETLKALGHDPGRLDGTFGSGTKAALQALYRALGYEVVEAGDASAVRAAEDAVASAQRVLEQAQQALAQVEANPPTPQPGDPDPVEQARESVRAAEEDLSRAQNALADVLRTTGPMLPLSEYVFLSQFPARVEHTTARLGVEVTNPLLTLSSGALVVQARVNAGQRALLAEGMAVEILAETMGISSAGTIANIGGLEDDEQTGRTHRVVVAPDAALDHRLGGADVRLTVETASTEVEVLVVPLTAIFIDTDGQTAVRKVTDDGDELRVLVTPGVSGDGYVAIMVAGAALEPGDLVVVGVGADR